MRKIILISVITFISCAFAFDIYAQCSSDFNCPFGYQCVKPPLGSTGQCMKAVNEFGVPTYPMPRMDSVFPNMNMQGDCVFDTDCPIGFRCHPKYKTCVKY